MRHRLGIVAALAIAWAVPPVEATRPNFVPDWTFKGSALTGWRPLGSTTWRAADGEIVATPASPAGGWLMLDRQMQDVQIGFDVRCAGACRIGVLLRAEKTADGGMKGVYAALSGEEAGSYAVTLDAAGKELSRERLRPAGGMMRFAPTAAEAAAAAAKNPGRGGGGAGGRGGRGGQPNTVKTDDWNDVDVIVDANILRQSLNGRSAGGGAADEDTGHFGPVALFAGGEGEVRFRDVSYKDLGVKRFPKEELSSHFRMLRLTPFYYSFSAAAADINRDGHLDVVAGPFIYYGPAFTDAREFYAAQTTSPSTTFSHNWVAFAGDFTGDGWPDVLLASTDNNRLYVNPKGEARRWDMYPNIIPPANQSELSVMKDLDGDGKPELIYVQRRRRPLRQAGSGKPERAMAFTSGRRRRARTPPTASAPATSTATAERTSSIRPDGGRSARRKAS